MAKKKRVKRAPKFQGITINWGVVGLIIVIALLIGFLQMTDKSSAATGGSVERGQLGNNDYSS